VTPLPPPAVSVAPEIITAGGCSKLKWDIQNVKEVYLNDEGVVGVGEREVCHTEPGLLTYTWRIIQLDGNVIKLERQLRVNPGASGTPAPPPAPVQ
jgi:flagellar basal body rod protein FlgF